MVPGHWDFDWLDVPALVAGAPAIFEYPMIDRDPLARWGSGRLSLLGDAAHPMYPIGSQRRFAGDRRRARARPRARALRPIRPARSRPTSGRAGRPRAVVHANRRHGPQQVVCVVEERAPDGLARIDDVIGQDELRAIADRYRHTAGFDVDELNARPSWTVARGA